VVWIQGSVRAHDERAGEQRRVGALDAGRAEVLDDAAVVGDGRLRRRGQVVRPAADRDAAAGVDAIGHERQRAVADALPPTDALEIRATLCSLCAARSY